MLLALWWMAATVAAIAGGDWRDAVAWRGQSARMEAGADGWTLHSPGGTRRIEAQPMATRTASTLFDGLFAMAQADLALDRVEAITDWSFNHQQPFPCACFETGEKWHYVWTRDLSYAADLALARLDPVRTRTSLRFKLSQVRNPDAPQGLTVAQDTGSGGSWPVSTDRVVWFLAARHLLDDRAFARATLEALRNTLAQDRAYAFDPAAGLYRGETSFLDWREQTYPAWTATDTTFIAQSFALSTNVLHYQALRLAAQLTRGAEAAGYARQAEALRNATDHAFWRQDRGMYASYVGADGLPVESFDLLGNALAITSGLAPLARARMALSHYPVTAAGSPVVWPQQPGIAIYHNRAIWPFVSAYALRAARVAGDGERIAHEVRSLMRGAALARSNMENYELATQAVHVDAGALSGPVVNSPRQLWSVAAYLDMVQRGIFGLEDDGRVRPMLPVQLVPMLFGTRDAITLRTPARTITLRRPATLSGALLVAGTTRTEGDTTVVDLVPGDAAGLRLARNGGDVAPTTPRTPAPRATRDGWSVAMPAGTRLYLDGRVVATAARARTFTQPTADAPLCFAATRVAQGLESLPSPEACVGAAQVLDGGFPRAWDPPRDGRFRASFRYRNGNGPVNTGITAGVMRLRLSCDGERDQEGPVVFPHREGEGTSTAWTFAVHAGAPCRFTLHPGFNMSDLAHFAHYTGGKGGDSGPLNAADVGALRITPAR